MTREEKIKWLIQDVWEDYRYKGYEAFKKVALKLISWADEHPKTPWISVKDRLPEDGQIIVLYITQTISGGGEKNVEHQMVVERYKGRFTCDRMEQQRMGGYMFDIVVKTTHWLPMPQLPKGGEV